MTRARIRGIYATALTAVCLDADHAVVQASEPIRERFDAGFPDEPADVAVETTADRQGVGLSGSSAAVAAIRDRCLDVGETRSTGTIPSRRVPCSTPA